MNTTIHSYSKSHFSDLYQAKKTWATRCLLAPRASGFRALAAASGPEPEENVVGVGIGEQLSEGKPTGIIAVKFFVRRKYAPSELTKKNLLPKTIDGLPVDVEQTGQFRPLTPAAKKGRNSKKTPAAPRTGTLPNPKLRFRPAQPGCSVGFQHPSFRMAGTFGAVVRDSSGTYILSNNHVLANEGSVPAGGPIFQPGLLDGGNASSDQVASLTRFVALRTGVANKVDGAIAKAISASILSKEILHIGAPAGSAVARQGMNVHKFGRTTSYTVGRITSIATDVTVPYEAGNMFFEDQIMIVGDTGSFSASGDSGSLILERETNKAVGLLFAGSATHTIANQIADVLAELAVTLA